jgi:hypothetical protein
MALGKARRFLEVGIINTLASAIGFGAGIPWGPTGVAIGYIAATYLPLVFILRYAFKDTPVSLDDFFKSIGFAASSSLLACTLVWFLAPGRFVSATPWAQVSIILPTFILALLLVLALIPGGFRHLRSQAEHIRTIFRKS